MALTLNSSNSYQDSTSDTNPTPGVAPESNDRVCVLTLSFFTSGSTGSTGTPTFKGNNMQQVGSTQTSAEGATEIWYYENPTTGSGVISIANGNGNSIRYSISFFESASEAAQYFGGNGASDGSAADVPASLDSVPDGSVCVSCMVHGEKDQFSSITGGTTLLGTASIDEGSTQTGAAYSIQSGTGTESHTYVSGGSSDDYNWVMGAWEPVTPTTTTTTTSTTTTVWPSTSTTTTLIP